MTSGKSFKVTSNLLWKVFSKAKSNGSNGYSIHEEVWFVRNALRKLTQRLNLVEDTRAGVRMEITLWVNIFDLRGLLYLYFSSQGTFE